MSENSTAMAAVRPLEVFSLICKRDIETSIPALRSVARHLKDSHTMTLLSDGSLSREDERRLADELPATRLIRRSELDSLVVPVLAAYKRCQRFRERWPWALKLIDLSIIAKENFGFIDSDVVMTRDLDGFDGAASKYDLVHMKSYANIYCVPLRERLRLAKQWQIVHCLNSGFMFVKEGRINLDVIEGALTALGNTAELPLAEQTVWAMAAARMNCVGFFDLEQIAFPLTLPSRPLAVHYIGATRGLLKNAVGKDLACGSGAVPEKLKIHPSQNCNLVNGAFDVARHKWILRRWERYKTSWSPQ